ncbi:MAG TPA: glycosyltransferase [Chthoniobacterales bacterium]|nr:glycosyltransferase [Chthoniobacterales bacterium]
MSSPKPLVASFCTFFLKPEMLHIYRQLTGLKTFETFVITKHRQNADRFPFDDVEPLVTPRRHVLRRGYLKYITRKPALIYRGEYDAVRRILIRRDPDLIHIYFGNTGVHLLPLLSKWDRAWVVSFHGMDVQKRPKEKGYDRKLAEVLQLAPLVLVRSQSLAKRLQDLGCNPEKIRLNRTGIPLQNFPWVERSVPVDGQWQLVQACRLVEKKGLLTTLGAFRRFIADYPKARLVIAGEGPMKDELVRRIAELSLENQVELAGFLNQDDLRRVYAESHIFIHPSELAADSNQEGIPNSMLEAMASGLPVVATQHGGIPEAVHEGIDGILVPERDESALYEALLKLATQPDLWRQMGKQASRSVAENFEQGQQVVRLEAAYAEALRSESSG